MMRRAQPWLGTLVDIALADRADDARLQQAFDSAFAAVGLVHRLMSFHDPDSDVSRINRAVPGQAVTVDPHTWQVLKMAKEFRQASGGAFDIACAPRLVQWEQLPACGAPVPEYVPGRPVFRLQDDGNVLKTADGWIDLGGIAKGYAVDLAIEALRAAGIGSASVNAGGDLRVLGSDAFMIAIRDPAMPTRMCEEIALRDEAMATSATYFSAKDSGSRRVSALCNGLNGEPITVSSSVSVRAPSCAAADALTKVVLSTADPHHPALTQFRATALLL